MTKCCETHPSPLRPSHPSFRRSSSQPATHCSRRCQGRSDQSQLLGSSSVRVFCPTRARLVRKGRFRCAWLGQVMPWAARTPSLRSSAWSRFYKPAATRFQTSLAAVQTGPVVLLASTWKPTYFVCCWPGISRRQRCFRGLKIDCQQELVFAALGSPWCMLLWCGRRWTGWSPWIYT